MSRNYIKLMNKSIKAMFRDALIISLKDPGLAIFIIRTIIAQNKAVKLRAKVNSSVS
jgi:hypothetical protein